jgi:hypothetical protein
MKFPDAFYSVVFTIAAASSPLGASQEHDEAATESAAVMWLSLVDSGDYSGSWTAAATRSGKPFRKSNGNPRPRAFALPWAG